MKFPPVLALKHERVRVHLTNTPQHRMYMLQNLLFVQGYCVWISVSLNLIHFQLYFYLREKQAMELICNKNAAFVILRTKILYAEHSAI
jgi:hypothetical protein